MADDTTGTGAGQNEAGEPIIRDNRKIDPETGDVRSPDSAAPSAPAPGPAAGSAQDTVGDGSLEDADVETSLSDADLGVLHEAEADLIGEMRSDMLRAQADLVNFRMRVERDRVTNREAVIAEVLRSLLPAMDDLTRAETHGDLEGSPLALVAQKLHTAFEKYGLREVGTKGEPFDPNFHEAIVQLPSPDVTVNTIADVIEPGYALGDRLIRAAKVAVHVPAE